MTGFARAEGFQDGYAWSWEVRSVNGRNLDVRAKLPPGNEALEMKARALVADRFRRGSISLTLNLARTDRGAAVRVNREVLDRMVVLARELAAETDAPPPRIEGLLSLQGVIERVEEADTDEARAAREAAMEQSLAEVLDGLAAMRTDEGARLDEAVAGHLARIAELAASATEAAASQPAALRRRLAEQVAALLDARVGVAEDRLAQEAALLATKADVREEIDRLNAHVTAARELMAAGGPIGRRLDFLCQEFNREANTLCSKATDIELTRIGLDLKASIEQLREQVQNIE